MDYENGSSVTEFILVGFSGDWQLQIFFFVIFSLIYGATVVGNILIIATVAANSTLHSPMYFLLGNLSFLDMCLSTVTTPTMIRDLLAEHKSISLWGCMAQMFFMHLFGGAEMTLLIVMAFDRYVAICKPLHYRTIMSHRLLHATVLLFWTIGFIHTMSQMVLIVNLPFCGHNIVNNIFCDLPLVVKLACIETNTLELFVIADSGLLSFICFILLLLSYIVILVTVKHKSPGRLSKALSTLSAHIMVVTLFFGPCIFIYAWPFGSFASNKVLAVFYTGITPVLNPIIYTLRNQEMKKAMKNYGYNKLASFRTYRLSYTFYHSLSIHWVDNLKSTDNILFKSLCLNHTLIKKKLYYCIAILVTMV